MLQVLIGVFYRWFEAGAAALQYRTKQCWQVNRGQGMSPVHSCEGTWGGGPSTRAAESQIPPPSTNVLDTQLQAVPSRSALISPPLSFLDLCCCKMR